MELKKQKNDLNVNKMEELTIQKNPDGKLEISNFGFKIEINPTKMFKENLDGRIQPLLDLMIEKLLIEALMSFQESEENTKENRRLLYEKEIEPSKLISY
jgi:hypothetical protein